MGQRERMFINGNVYRTEEGREKKKYKIVNIGSLKYKHSLLNIDVEYNQIKIFFEYIFLKINTY